MRVLLITQYFPPEIGAAASRWGDYTNLMVKQGHQVTVLCEMPNYPKGNYFPGYNRSWVKKEIVSPGHIFPIISKDGGVLVRAGHTEASVDISTIVKKNPSAVICEIMNDNGVMAKGFELFKFAKKHKLKIAKIEDLIAYRLKKEKFIKFKKSENIFIKNQPYKIKIFENILDGSENFALVKGDLNKTKNPRVRVVSSNIVQNYLMGKKLPNSFNRTLKHFKNYTECVLIFIRDANLKSVSQTLRDYKNNKFYKKGQDKLIKNYGIGAQIIKAAIY